MEIAVLKESPKSPWGVLRAKSAAAGDAVLDLTPRALKSILN